MVLREVELFVKAEDILVEVLGRIRAENWRTVLPPLFPRPGARPTTIRQAVRKYAQENARLPDVLAGRTPREPDGDVLGPDPQASIGALSAAACRAVEALTDGTAVVQTDQGELTVSDYLWRLDISRCFFAHDVAIHIGSRACPFTEELAKGMWEGTWPVAARWRELGLFGEPLPLPDHVSWRDRFLLCAGRDPHPLVH